jgi:hypothetical protein
MLCVTSRCAIQLKRGIGVVKHNYTYISVVGILTASQASYINPLNAELNPICHLLALIGGATIVDVSRLRVKGPNTDTYD